MKLYTRTGDKGKTSVIGGRVDKDDLRVETYGTVDELNCLLGHAVSLLSDGIVRIRPILEDIQHDLFDLGVDLATIDPKENKITPEKVAYLEKHIDELSEQTPEIKYFILPGGTQASSVLHVGRAVCRRAERSIVSLSKQHAINLEAIKYINRLSDFLFAAARWANHTEQVADIRYESRKP